MSQGMDCAEQAHLGDRNVCVISFAPPGAAELHGLITSAGYVPVVFHDPGALIDRARGGTVAALLIVIDEVSEPAHTLLTALHQQQSNASVVIGGPEIGADAVAALLKEGASDYLTVPLDGARLGASLRNALETRKAFLRVQDMSSRLRQVNVELAEERDALRRWNDNLMRLNDLGQALASTVHVDDMVEILAERLGRIVPFDLLGILGHVPEGLWIRGPRAVHLDAVHELRDSLMKARKSPAGAVDDHVTDRQPGGLLVPLVSANHPLGLLRVERYGKPDFDRAEVDWIQTAATSLALALSNAAARRELEQLAILDGLTNVLNRRGFDAALERELKTVRRYGASLCLVLGDLDHFKHVNDRLGHPAGDALLKHVAALLTQQTRTTDTVARYGGEEFAILLPRTDPVAGQALAERIRRCIEDHVFVVGESTVRLTLSFGVTGFREGECLDAHVLVSRADHALYRAKAAGRNTVMSDDGVAAAGRVVDAPGGNRLITVRDHSHE